MAWVVGNDSGIIELWFLGCQGEPGRWIDSARLGGFGVRAERKPVSAVTGMRDFSIKIVNLVDWRA